MYDYTKLKPLLLDIQNAYSDEDSIRILLKNVKQALFADGSGLFILNAKDEFVLYDHINLIQNTNEPVVFPKEKGIIGLAAKSAGAFHTLSAQSNPDFLAFPIVKELSYNSVLALPIYVRKKLIGVCAAYKIADEKFSSIDEANFMALVAQSTLSCWHIAINIENIFAKKFDLIQGIPISSGHSFGEIKVIKNNFDLKYISTAHIIDLQKESNNFLSAIVATKKEIHHEKNNIAQSSKELFEIYDFYDLALKDDVFIKEIIAHINKGNIASNAVKFVINNAIEGLENSADVYLFQRKEDLKNLAFKIISNLDDKNNDTEYPRRCILVGNKLSVNEILKVPKNNLVGIISFNDSSLSHFSIVARNLDIPVIITNHKYNLCLLEQRQAVIDGNLGKLHLNPSKHLINKYLSETKSLSLNTNKVLNNTRTKDNHKINLSLELGVIQKNFNTDFDVGLFRSEIIFMHEDKPLSELSQTYAYKTILQQFANKEVIIRTLDIGADKSPSYIKFTATDFISQRGIKVMLNNLGIFITQIKALLAANTSNNLKILIPMISSIEELAQAKAIINQCFDELVKAKQNIFYPKIGIMIEVPSCIFILDELLKHVDFISIGSNDLLQYLTANDRNLYDDKDIFEPAFLKSLQTIIDKSLSANIPVSVCGRLSTNLHGIFMLLGLGLTNFTLSTKSIKDTQEFIGKLNMSTAAKIMKQALNLSRKQEIYQLINTQIVNINNVL